MSQPVMANLSLKGGLKSTGSESDKHFSSYPAQAISCIFCNVYLRTVKVAILFFLECPKSIASKVLPTS